MPGWRQVAALAGCGLLLLNLQALVYHYTCVHNHEDSGFDPYLPAVRALIVPLVGLIWYHFAAYRSFLIVVYTFVCSAADLLAIHEDIRLRGTSLGLFGLAHFAMILYCGLKFGNIRMMAVPFVLANFGLIALLVPVFLMKTREAAVVGIYMFVIELAGLAVFSRSSAASGATYWMPLFGYLFLIAVHVQMIRESLMNEEMHLEIPVVCAYVFAQLMILVGISIDPELVLVRRQVRKDKRHQRREQRKLKGQ